MKISFPYESKPSHIFGLVKRPIAQVGFWSKKRNRWLNYSMIVDTGADYTLLPYSASSDLGLDLKKDSSRLKTFGIGGSENVFLILKYKIRIGSIDLDVPVGFLERDDIPPLLGRQDCLNKLDVRFYQYKTSFNFPK